MIKINLSSNEITRLVEFSRKELDSAHLGSDDFMIPEYQILKDKLVQSTHFIELNNTEAEILCGWISDGVASSRIRKIEDELLAGKIYDAIHEEYMNIKIDYLFRITKLRESLNIIAKLAGKDEIGSGV